MDTPRLIFDAEDTSVAADLIAARLARLLADERTFALLAGEVLEIGVDGEDVDAQRFYERHGYVDHDTWSDQPSRMYFRELTPER